MDFLDILGGRLVVVERDLFSIGRKDGGRFLEQIDELDIGQAMDPVGADPIQVEDLAVVPVELAQGLFGTVSASMDLMILAPPSPSSKDMPRLAASFSMAGNIFASVWR